MWHIVKYIVSYIKCLIIILMKPKRGEFILQSVKLDIPCKPSMGYFIQLWFESSETSCDFSWKKDPIKFIFWESALFKTPKRINANMGIHILHSQGPHGLIESRSQNKLSLIESTVVWVTQLLIHMSLQEGNHI